jgi:hypothetical protein
MPKRIRVVTGDEKITRRTIVASDNPKASKLTENELKARAIAKYATTTTMGFGMRKYAGDVMDSGGGQFYSPQLSTDFLEKPQNLRERRAFYRFFYNSNELVGRAIDIHSELPMSKLRLVPPKAKNHHQAEYVQKFFTDMCENMKLFETLIEVSFEFQIFGNAYIYAEDNDLRDGLSPDEISAKKEEAKQKAEFLKNKYDIKDTNPLYKGWSKLLILPPDQVRVRKLPLTDAVAIEYQPDPETRKFLTSDIPFDPTDPTRKIKNDISEELKEKVRQSGVIPMDTDPYSGSHVHHIARKKSQYEPMGTSILERCVGTLIYMDKLRQAQTSIASRHMTPMRIVWSEGLSNSDVDNLREQVDLALVDPDFSIIANYEIHWEEMGSQGRILDLEGEYTGCTDRLLAGLGMTREILTGEGSYSGSRISLEIMNTQYLLFRERIQEYVENYLFKPVARKKGFIEYDDYGNEVLIYPRLSFTRLSIRDNERFFDSVFQLYQKGSISVDLILDILNIDPISTREKIEKDLLTVNDSMFNEVMRNIYTNASAAIVEKTDVVAKLSEYLKLKMTETTPPPEGTARFSSSENLDKDHAVKLAKLITYMKKNPQALDKMFNGVSNEKVNS